MSLLKVLLAAQQAVSIAATSTGSASSSSTLSIDKPSGVGEGTLLIAFVVRDDATGTVLPPSGWTELIDTIGRSVHYKRVGASDPTSYSWTFSSSVDSQGFIVALSGADYDAIGALSANASPAVAPTVTAAAANSLVLAWFSRPADASITFTTPSGYTAVTADSDTSAPSAALFSKSVGAGAVGTASSTPSSTTARGIQIVVKPR